MVRTKRSEAQETKPSAVAPPVSAMSGQPAWLIGLFGLVLGLVFSFLVVIPGSTAEIPHSEVETLRQLANKGNAKAQLDLGRKYEKGDGVPQDDAEAVKWYRKSAEQGNAKAQEYLGFMYEKGRGVSYHFHIRVTWLCRGMR